MWVFGTPELTTVHVAKEQIAHLAVDILIKSIESDDLITTKITVIRYSRIASSMVTPQHPGDLIRKFEPH